MAWFSFARQEGFPTQYAPNETAVTVDVVDAGLLTAFFILLLSCLLSVITNRLIVVWRLLRLTILLSIGTCVLLGNFGQEWEVGKIATKTPYKAGSSAEIQAAVGIKIGLRSVNVTLKNIGKNPDKLRSEIINYNERFSWEWDQGRFGFGPYAGELQREFRAAQLRGLPLPILWVMDYFVIDGEGFRSGRFYRTAGWFSHIVMWCAFTCWILSIIFFQIINSYGAIFLGFCGLLQLLANLLWLVIRNPNELDIPFEDATIRTKFGTSFWLTFLSGLASVLIALVLLLFNYLWPEMLAKIFENDIDNSFDEDFIYQKELDKMTMNASDNDQEMFKMESGGSHDDSERLISVQRRKSFIIPPQVPPRRYKPWMK